MAREIPELVRAAAGLAATVLDEARKLPETLPGLPVRVIGMAMQQAMKVQQHYACLVARGDELFTGLRGENEPGLATFDDEEPAPTPGFRDSAFDRAGDTLLEPLPEELQRNFVVEVELSETETTELRRDRGADALAAEVEEAAEQVEEALQCLDVLAGEAPSTEEVLDELAIEEMVAEAPVTEAPVTEDAAAVQTALTESAAARPEPSAPPKAGKKAKKAAAKKATPAAAPAEAPAEEPKETPAAETPAAEAPAATPDDGYDSFTIAE
jgi:hypothetical protein